MIKNKTIIFLSILLCQLSLQAEPGQEPTKKMQYKGFSGGMFVHSGAMRSGGFSLTTSDGSVMDYKIDGHVFGVGGKIGFHFGDHLRIGSEGYATTTHYGSTGSKQEVNWGGIFVDAMLPIKKFTLFAGATFGGGGVSHVVVTEDPLFDFETEEVLFRHYSILIVNPFVGVEYAITPKISGVFKTDYMLNVSNPQPDYATGMRLYLGIIFRHRPK